MLVGAASPYNEMFPGKWVVAEIGLMGWRGLAQGACSRFQILTLVSNQYWAKER